MAYIKIETSKNQDIFATDLKGWLITIKRAYTRERSSERESPKR